MRAARWLGTTRPSIQIRTGIDPAGTVGFVYANGAVTVMPLGQYDPNFIIPLNNPFAINDGGQITGTYATAGPKCVPALGCVQSDAYIYDSTTGASTDLGWGNRICHQQRGPSHWHAR